MLRPPASSTRRYNELKLPDKNEILLTGFLLSMFLQKMLLSRPNPKSSRAKPKIPTEGKPPRSLIHRGLQHFSRPPPRRGTPAALHPNSAKCHTKLREDPHQHLLPVLVPMCYWSSNSVHSEVQVFMRFMHHSSRTGGEKELMLHFVATFPSWRAPTQCAIASNCPLPHSLPKHFFTEKNCTPPKTEAACTRRHLKEVP